MEGHSFLWGAATSSYQVEGGITNNDWDFYTRSKAIKNRISILTRRDRKTIPYVYNWLESKNIDCDDLIYIFDSTPKSIYPFDILIDDAPHNLAGIKFPKKAILFDQPWNRNFDWPIRINQLSDLFRILQ